MKRWSTLAVIIISCGGRFYFAWRSALPSTTVFSIAVEADWQSSSLMESPQRIIPVLWGGVWQPPLKALNHCIPEPALIWAVFPPSLWVHNVCENRTTRFSVEKHYCSFTATTSTATAENRCTTYPLCPVCLRRFLHRPYQHTPSTASATSSSSSSTSFQSPWVPVIRPCARRLKLLPPSFQIRPSPLKLCPKTKKIADSPAQTAAETVAIVIIIDFPLMQQRTGLKQHYYLRTRLKSSEANDSFFKRKHLGLILTALHVITPEWFPVSVPNHPVYHCYYCFLQLLNAAWDEGLPCWSCAAPCTAGLLCSRTADSDCGWLQAQK